MSLLSLSVYAIGWSFLCALIPLCTTGVKLYPESYESDFGEVRLLKPALNHTHSNVSSMG